MKAREIISEVLKINVSDQAFEHDFDPVPPSAKWQKLPGDSGLTWASFKSPRSLYIWIAQSTEGQKFVAPKRQRYEFDVEHSKRVAAEKKKWEKGYKIVGQLSLSASNDYNFLPDAYQVNLIYVDPKARGQSIAKSLYGIALYTLKLTLMAGNEQTRGGRRNWASLSQIPGVEVKGIVVVDDYYLGAVTPAQANNMSAQAKRSVDNIIDTVMQLGGDYLGVDKHKDHCFAFDVVPSTGELAPAVKTAMSKIYGHGGNDLFARWVG